MKPNARWTAHALGTGGFQTLGKLYNDGLEVSKTATIRFAKKMPNTMLRDTQ
jgi:hypothetical protein